MNKLTDLFKQTQQENDAVNELIEEANQQLLDDGSVKETIVTNFTGLSKEILKGMSQIFDQKNKNRQMDRTRRSTVFRLKAQSTLDLNPSSSQISSQFRKEIVQSLPLSVIYIYVQSFEKTNESIPPGTYLRLQYGRVDPDNGIFISAMESQSRKLEFSERHDFEAEKLGPNPVELMAEFNYMPQHNYFRLELISSDRQILAKVFPLTDLPFNRFVERRLLA